MTTTIRRESKATRNARMFETLRNLGFTFEEVHQLRRIERTLHRWAELECGDGNNYSSWSIERDETTGKPFRCVYPHSGKSYRVAIADREKGALKRLGAIIAARNARAIEADYDSVPSAQIDSLTVVSYHQGDPRGCALYIVRRADVPDLSQLDSLYTRGIAVAFES